jgi:hypothetical protein
MLSRISVGEPALFRRVFKDKDFLLNRIQVGSERLVGWVGLGSYHLGVHFDHQTREGKLRIALFNMFWAHGSAPLQCLDGWGSTLHGYKNYFSGAGTVFKLKHHSATMAVFLVVLYALLLLVQVNSYTRQDLREGIVDSACPDLCERRQK